MSRMSLRRQVFYRNVDRYDDNQDISGPAVHRKSHGDHEAVIEELESILSQMETQDERQTGNHSMIAPFPAESEDNAGQRGQRPLDRPISRYDDVTYATLTQSSDVNSNPVFNGTSNNSRVPVIHGVLHCYRTPGYPMDKSTPIPGVHGNSSPGNIFRFPDRSKLAKSKIPLDSGVPMSPIPTRDSIRTPLTHSAGQRKVPDDDAVPVLPTSPAAFLTTHTLSPSLALISQSDPILQIALDETTVNHGRLSGMSVVNLPSWGQMCRICHEDGSRERLVSPCHCKGTMGMLHINCLAKWLGSSNTTRCEICTFKFTVQKSPRPLKWYLREPRLKRERKTFLTDVILSIVLFVCVIIVCVICFIYGLKLTRSNRPNFAIILVVISVATCIMYAVWSWCVFPRIQRQWETWQRKYQVINIKQDINRKKRPQRNKDVPATGEIIMAERPLRDEEYQDITSLVVENDQVP